MAQITSVTSELLQAKIRSLLPSQQGFGEDLQAQNVIVPVIDLTETAEGSSVRQDLQTALSFGSMDTHQVAAANTTIINTTGFYRVFGNATIGEASSSARKGKIILGDGTTNKIIWSIGATATSANVIASVNYDFVVFVNTGENVQITSDTVDILFGGSTRQIADINGVLVNPSGFNPQ
tara:strand:+ start:958 stop:1494 length:537 start_codon:yes stop_codon:yes gene_type:complete